MMKFFRKYTKHLLAVFMALLLVIWLGGEALTSAINRDRDFSKTVVGHVFGKEVKQAEFARIHNQSEIGSSLIGETWNYPWATLVGRMVGNSQYVNFIIGQVRQTPLEMEDWYLLDAEARRNGVHVMQDAINQLKQQLPTAQLNAVRDRHNLSVAQIDATLQAYLRVEEAAMLAMAAVKVSEADIQNMIRLTGEKVGTGMVVVEASRLVDNSVEPTEAELQAQFEKCKDQPAGPVGTGQYGYQLPDATQIEFIEVNVKALAPSQLVTDDEAYNYWLGHKDDFKKPATQPATSSAPATQPRPEPPKPYETFTEAKPHVFETLQTEKAKKVAGDLAGSLIRQLARPWNEQPTSQPSGFKEIPESAKAGDVYEKLVASMQDKYAGVLSYGRTALADAKELMTHAKLGRTAAFPDTPQRVPMNRAAFLVAGLGDPKAMKDPAVSRLKRNLFQTCMDPVFDSAGNAYVFRNVVIRPAQPPASWEEVRNTLVRDIREIKAYEEAERIARDLAERAKKESLKAAFQSDAALAVRLGNAALKDPPSFSRKAMGGQLMLFDSFIPGVGRVPGLVDLAFSLGGEATTTQPTPVAVQEDKAQQRWIVVEWHKAVPVTRAEYDEQRELLRQFLLMQKRINALHNWFDSDRIHARTQWKPTKSESGEEKSEPTQAAAGA